MSSLATHQQTIVCLFLSLVQLFFAPFFPYIFTNFATPHLHVGVAPHA